MLCTLLSGVLTIFEVGTWEECYLLIWQVRTEDNVIFSSINPVTVLFAHLWKLCWLFFVSCSKALTALLEILHVLTITIFQMDTCFTQFSNNGEVRWAIVAFHKVVRASPVIPGSASVSGLKSGLPPGCRCKPRQNSHSSCTINANFWISSKMIGNFLKAWTSVSMILLCTLINLSRSRIKLCKYHFL